MTLALEYENNTVIDLTYLCNATCKYCQRGDRLTIGRTHRPLEDILMPEGVLRSLGTQRIVLSGGEPRLHPHLEHVLHYYHELVDDVIVISNGYGLDVREVTRLVDAGATGLTISLDSVSSDMALATRETPSSLHAQILSNLRIIAAEPRKFELGINSVVSHMTA